MNAKNISKAMAAKVNSWLSSIDDEKVRDIAKKNTLVTGGALVSMLNSEEPNDLDIYFKTMEATEAVAQYYAAKWNEKKATKVEIKNTDGRITCYIKSIGVAEEIV